MNFSYVRICPTKSISLKIWSFFNPDKLKDMFHHGFGMFLLSQTIKTPFALAEKCFVTMLEMGHLSVFSGK